MIEKLCEQNKFRSFLISFIQKTAPYILTGLTGVAVGSISTLVLLNKLPASLKEQAISTYQQLSSEKNEVSNIGNSKYEHSDTSKDEILVPVKGKSIPQTELLNTNNKTNHNEFLGNKKYPRGIRNNNPGNIEKGENWQGLGLEQLDSRFATFESPEMGIRAIAKILKNYNLKYKINTISGIISRWAPSHENDTNSYINKISKAANIGKDDIIDFNNEQLMFKIIKAIITHENGMNPYKDETILNGIRKSSSNKNWLIKLSNNIKKSNIRDDPTSRLNNTYLNIGHEPDDNVMLYFWDGQNLHTKEIKNLKSYDGHVNWDKHNDFLFSEIIVAGRVDLKKRVGSISTLDVNRKNRNSIKNCINQLVDRFPDVRFTVFDSEGSFSLNNFYIKHFS